MFNVSANNKNEKTGKRPNVLWIYLEDVSGWMSCYGDSVIETPNMDALADEGIRFNRYYATAGVCSASRSAVLTGMMQTTIGAHHHRSSRPEWRGKKFNEFDRNNLPEDVVPLPIAFRKAGYYTFNEGGKDDYNFMFDISELYDYERGLFDKGWAPRSFLAGDCLNGNIENKPWFGQLQLGGGKLRKLKPVVDREKVPVFPYYPDIPEMREEIAYHYDCLLETDNQVGQIIQKLKEMGEYENTLIFLFSDHGMKLHRHKQFLYEGGIKMPFILLGPGVEKGKINEQLISGIDISATSLAVAGIDVPENMEGQNILDPNWKGHKYVIAARDRCDFTIEKIRAVVTPDFKYLKNYLTDRTYMQPSYKDNWPITKRLHEMMVAGQMNEEQLVFFGENKPAEELYDLANDPNELHNLANDPKYKTVLKKHRRMLECWIEETGDKGQNMESEIGLRCVYQRWGKRCVNPEYDKIK
jgi:arylsulfatase A-like enzyme